MCICVYIYMYIHQTFGIAPIIMSNLVYIKLLSFLGGAYGPWTLSQRPRPFGLFLLLFLTLPQTFCQRWNLRVQKGAWPGSGFRSALGLGQAACRRHHQLPHSTGLSGELWIYRTAYLGMTRVVSGQFQHFENTRCRITAKRGRKEQKEQYSSTKWKLGYTLIPSMYICLECTGDVNQV